MVENGELARGWRTEFVMGALWAGRQDKPLEPQLATDH